MKMQQDFDTFMRDVIIPLQAQLKLDQKTARKKAGLLVSPFIFLTVSSTLLWVSASLLNTQLISLLPEDKTQMYLFVGLVSLIIAIIIFFWQSDNADRDKQVLEVITDFCGAKIEPAADFQFDNLMPQPNPVGLLYSGEVGCSVVALTSVHTTRCVPGSNLNIAGRRVTEISFDAEVERLETDSDGDSQSKWEWENYFEGIRIDIPCTPPTSQTNASLLNLDEPSALSKHVQDNLTNAYNIKIDDDLANIYVFGEDGSQLREKSEQLSNIVTSDMSLSAVTQTQDCITFLFRSSAKALSRDLSQKPERVAMIAQLLNAVENFG